MRNLRGQGAARFSLAHLTALECTPPELVRIAAQAGYDFVSPRLIMQKSPNEKGADYALENQPQMLRDTRQALADTGLRVLDIELARIFDGVDVGTYVPALEIAAELGARHVISSVWTSAHGYAVEQFARLCEVAEPLGLTINLEPVSWSGLKALPAAMQFLQEAARPNIGILIDTLHFHRSGVGLEQLSHIPQDWINFIHLCDAPGDVPDNFEAMIVTAREERLYLGEGGIDVEAIVERLPGVPFSIELPNFERVKELGYLEHARRCLASAKSRLHAQDEGSVDLQLTRSAK